MSLPWVIAVFATVLGALFPFLSNTRLSSGRAGTSDAITLWAESTKMREEYRARIAELNEVVNRCEQRSEQLEDRNDTLTRENEKLHGMIATLTNDLSARDST